MASVSPNGLMMLAFGSAVGAALALLLFMITVLGLPLLLDREVDFVTAMITSIKTVATSPAVLLGWGVVVTVSMLVACVPFFLGLLVVLPVLGHTTWHIYRRAVGPA